MKQIFLGGDGQPQLLDCPAPGLLDRSALVETTFSLISSGTEGAAVTRSGGLLGMWEKAINSRDRVEQVINIARAQGVQSTLALIREKMADAVPLGYSATGIVRRVSDPTVPFVEGDRVACFGTGIANHAEFNMVPQNMMARIPHGVADRDAAFGALACIAMQGIRRLDLSPGESVGVVGLGLIGQICTRILLSLGYRAFATDLSEDRIIRAERQGVTGWRTGEARSVIGSATNGVGLDGVIICAASKEASLVNDAFDVCRKLGRVAIVGDVSMDLVRSKMYQKELELRMSASYGPGRYDPEYELAGRDYPIQHARWTQNRNLALFLDMLANRRVVVDDLISGVYPIADYAQAYELLKNRSADNFGILFDYEVPPLPQQPRPEPSTTILMPVTSKCEGKVRLGIIGVGAYAKNVHIPRLRQHSDLFSIHGLASRSGSSAASLAKRSNAHLVTSDYRELLSNPEIDAVLIATRHSSHGRIICEALDAGKHVFVEKPMTISLEEADAVVERVKETGLCLRVGFNRRFSPYLQPFRQAMSSRQVGMLTMRVNIGDVGAHWSGDSAEGGRFLGEATHFIDLANWIFDSAPTGVSAVAAGEAHISNPNMNIVLTYPSGATATLIYTTYGHPRLGKEMIELFVAGKSLRCDDYSSLVAHGCRNAGSRLRKGDKGQSEVLVEFGLRVLGRDHPVAGADANAGREATKIALSAYEILSRSVQRIPSED